MADRHVLELRTMEVVTTCNGGPLRPRPCARPEGSPEYGSADFTKVLLMRLETHSARVCVCAHAEKSHTTLEEKSKVFKYAK